MASTISKHPRTGMATFRNSVAPARLLWPEGRSQAPNVRVVVGDLRATPNLLKSQTEKNLLSPYCNTHAVTSKLCACPRLAIVPDHPS
jgi:hypothetical protein